MPELFHPGVFIAEEVAARGMVYSGLADLLGMPKELVAAVVLKKEAVPTPYMCERLGEVFGMGEKYWINLTKAWEVYKYGAGR